MRKCSFLGIIVVLLLSYLVVPAAFAADCDAVSIVPGVDLSDCTWTAGTVLFGDATGADIEGADFRGIELGALTPSLSPFDMTDATGTPLTDGTTLFNYGFCPNEVLFIFNSSGCAWLPTAVSLDTFEAQTTAPAAPVTLIALLALGTGVLILLLRKKAAAA